MPRIECGALALYILFYRAMFPQCHCQFIHKPEVGSSRLQGVQGDGRTRVLLTLSPSDLSLGIVAVARTSVAKFMFFTDLLTHHICGRVRKTLESRAPWLSTCLPYMFACKWVCLLFFVGEKPFEPGKELESSSQEAKKQEVSTLLPVSDRKERMDDYWRKDAWYIL